MSDNRTDYDGVDSSLANGHGLELQRDIATVFEYSLKLCNCSSLCKQSNLPFLHVPKASQTLIGRQSLLSSVGFAINHSVRQLGLACLKGSVCY